MDVVVDADHIDQIFLPAEFTRLPTCDHVVSFELTAVIRVRCCDVFRCGISCEHIDHRIYVKKFDARIDLPHRLDRFNSRAHELPLYLVTAISCEWIKYASIAASPREERDFVDWANQWRFNFLAQLFCRGPCECSETPNKLRAENVDAIRPSIMPKVPDDLHPRLTRSVNDRLCGRKIVTIWLRFDQVPAQSLTRRKYSVTLK